MKVRDIVAALSKVDQNADINFRVGYTPAYRKLCAKLLNEEEGGDGCLSYLCIGNVKSEQYFPNGEPTVEITLVQDYFTEDYFDECLRQFIEEGGSDGKNK